MENATPHRAWQPLTFSGVAAFAGETFTRLWMVQLIVSILVAGSMVWTLETGWFPVIEQAIDGLADNAEIRNRQLEWPNDRSTPLAENSFLSIRVDPDGIVSTDQGADIQLVFTKTGLKVRSLLGFVEASYPAGWAMSLRRADVRAWWGAWRFFLPIGLGVMVVLCLFINWSALACLYCFPVRVIAFYLDRAVTWRSCWRLAAAALLPGALVMSGGLVLYSLHRIELVGLLFAWLLHVIVAWVYVAYSPTRLPRLGNPPASRKNPFGEDNS